MSRPYRMFDPNLVYFVTNRTVQSRFLLTPNGQLNNLVGGVLAKALSKYQIELYAFVFTSNHFHLMLKTKEGELSRFMSFLQANIAKEVGRIHDWSGSVWQRRFSAEPILDDESIVDKLRYIISHGVKEGLVEKVADWPGLKSSTELCSNVVRLFPWIDRNAMAQAGRHGKQVRECDFTHQHPLHLNTLPCWTSMGSKEIKKRVKKIILEVEQETKIQRGDKAVLGIQNVLFQHPHSRPQQSKRSPRPLCHAASKALRNRYKVLYKRFVNWYKRASELFRQGELDVEFPPYAYRPPIPYQRAGPLPQLAF